MAELAAAGSIASVVSAVLEVGKCLAAPIGQFKYLYNYNTNLKNLETEVMTLKNTRDEVQVKVDAAEINGEEIKQSVKEWQTKVNNAINEAERLIEEKEENRRCFKGLRPNCINSYNHSKKAFKLKRDDIGPLLQQEERFDEVSYSSIQQSNYETNFDKIRDDVLKLKNARLKVERKVEEAIIKGEEIEEDVKKWLEDVDSIIAKAEELIENQSSIGTDHKTRYQNSKAASELMVDHIGPLLQQEERFDEVSYSTTLLSNYETKFDKLRDDVLKLKNARLKVERKVEEAKIKEEEIEEDVKKWLEDVDSILAKAEELIENQSSIVTDHKTRYQNSKAASDLMVADIGPLLQQEERFDNVSYSTTLLSNYETNFDKLRDDVLKLKNARLKVERKVEEAENNVEEIEEDVKKWLEDVDSIIVKAQELIENQNSIGTDRKTRYQNSKAASELMVDHIGPLLRQEKSFKTVSHGTIHREIWLRSNEDYLAFESRNSTLKDVWDALKDENIYMIGVYGMGGLGKTTLVQEVGRQAEKDKLFKEIVFVEVTETLDVKKVQTEIADKLGLKFSNESERANKLNERLKSGKKILLILDNIWEDLDLKTIGLPSSKMDSGGCKLLLTTRNLDVLQKMDSTNNFGMGILKEEEAWNLFQKMAGGVIQTPGLNSLPQDVCKECGGLPIVICTIAKALRSKRDPFNWEDALGELRAPSPTKFVGLLEEDYQKIALSYKYLRSDELRKTFLISSLMGNDTSISDLFKHVVSLDILEGANLTMERARNRLNKLVRELKDLCLLLEGSRSKQFSMHDVIRAIAITIAYTDHHVLTERNDIEKEWKDKDKLGKCTKICILGDDVICQLWHEELDFPNLEFFSMDMNNSFDIHENLFKKMPKLKVLNLFRMRLSTLPQSLDLLTNLQTLCLDGSKIKDAAIIGKLKKLKVLSLQNANIGQLPTEMGQLTQLKLLDLSNCRGLKVIAPNVISKLSQLEELHVKGCCIQCKVEVLKELKHLSKLASLEIDIKDIKMLPGDLFSKELKRYNISIGCEWFHPYKWANYEPSRILRLKYDSDISLEELRIFKNVELLELIGVSDDDNNLTALFNEKVVFSNLMALKLMDICSRKIWDSQPPTSMSSSYDNLTQLTLYSCRNIRYAFPSFIAKSLMQLQHLEINYCDVLEEIVAKEEGANAVVNFVFPHVTLLRLENLPKLTAFYPQRQTSEWPMLKELVVTSCDKFTSEYMSFQENSEEGEHISEPKFIFLDDKINSGLEELDLLDKLRRITWKSLSKHLEIAYDKSANIPLGLLQKFENLKEFKLYENNQYEEIKGLVDLPNLEVLEVIECNNLMTLLPSSASFQNLKVLKVRNCDWLMMKLITPSMARSLVQLREMSIGHCKMITEIVENEGDVTMSIEIVFNNLKKLSLKGLESLTCFCSGNYSFNFPSLEELDIWKCPNMKTFSQGILSTPKLHKIDYDHVKKELGNGGSKLNTTIQQAHKKKVDSNLKELTLTLSGRDIISIWEGELQERFGQVKTLELIKDEYANIPIQILHKFNSLEKLILKVSSYEEIFSSKEDEEQVGALTKLKVLELWGLFNLKCISKQDSRLNSILQNLDDLLVIHCHSLTTLLPSLVSFENMKILHLVYCNEMQNLMSSSTAQSLVRLEELVIAYCEMMIEVLSNGGDIEKGEIVFEKLEKLYLYNLDNLTCFSSENSALKFPFLKKLKVSECPKMKTFFGGGLNMPKLQKLNYDDCSESDIDTIIQQLQNDCSNLWERFPGDKDLQF